MHRNFVAWLSEKPWRAALFAAIFGVLSLFGFVPFAIAAGAVPVFMLLHKGVAPGINAANAGTIWVGGLIWVLTESAPSALASVGVLIWLPLLLAMLLRRFGSLTLCFQVALLVAGICLGLMYLVVEDPTAKWHALIENYVEPLRQAGFELDTEALNAFRIATNWGLYFTMLLLSVISALFLGRWWHSLLDAPGGFGAEYRQLRLGKVLGGFALLVVVGGFAFGKLGVTVSVVDAWMWIAMTGLAFQGLAAAHKLKASGVIGRGWLTAIYVLLIVPISTVLMIILLAGWGLADNWQRSRARGA